MAVSNAVSYTTPTISGFSASVMSSVSDRKNERKSFSLNYANGPLAAQYLQLDNTGNTAGDLNLMNVATLVNPDSTDAQITKAEEAIVAAFPTDAKAKQTSIGASYNFGVAKLNVLNVKSEDKDGKTTADITGVNASMPMGAYTILAGYAKDKKKAATADTKMSLGVSYALSKRTTLGADVFKAEVAGGSTGFVLRARHTF